MRKSQPLKVKGFKKSKKANHQTLSKLVPEHSKNISYVAMLFIEFQDNL